MKKPILFVFILLQAAFSFSMAENAIKPKDKLNILDSIGKKIRRTYHVRRHDDVSSTVSQWKNEQFQIYLKNRSNEETPLNSVEVESILTCFKNTQCDVYLYEVSSSYMSGFGMTNHWVLLNKDNSYSEIIHLVYAE